MFMAAIFIFMVICLLFQGLMPWFSKTNIFETAAEKERGRLVYVLMDGQKHFNKLFESKLFVNFFHFVLLIRGFGDGYVFHI